VSAASAARTPYRVRAHSIGGVQLPALMSLLFVVGVMNLLWVAALAGFVLMEKLARAGLMTGRVAGLRSGHGERTCSCFVRHAPID
jgi:hypothetical protein